jgi:hypothetical protein
MLILSQPPRVKQLCVPSLFGIHLCFNAGSSTTPQKRQLTATPQEGVWFNPIQLQHLRQSIPPNEKSKQDSVTPQQLGVMQVCVKLRLFLQALQITGGMSSVGILSS